MIEGGYMRWVGLLLGLSSGLGVVNAAEPMAPTSVEWRDGNGINTGMLNQDMWINRLKSGCNFCHQLGNTLDIDVQHVFAAKPDLVKTHLDAWEWRLGVGVRGTNMYSVLARQGKDPSLKAYSSWTERIAAGELPPAPPRPDPLTRRCAPLSAPRGRGFRFKFVWRNAFSRRAR